MRPFVARLRHSLSSDGKNGRFSLLHHQPTATKNTPHWQLTYHESEQLIFAGHGLIWNWFSNGAESPQTFFEQFEADYQAAGVDFLCRLAGQFGYVLYDKQKAQLFAFRDHIGYHVLYYLEQDGELFVSPRASQLYPLKKERQLSLVGLKSFFKFGFVMAPHTPVAGINRLLPGEYITCGSDGNITRYRYWTPPPFAPDPKSDAYFVERSRQMLWDALLRNLNGADKVAIFLSGGVDSAVFAGMLAQLEGVETTAYTFGLDVFHSRVNYQTDLPHARMVAQKHHLAHEEIILDQHFSMARALCQAIHTYDVPYVTPNMITKRLLAQRVRDNGIDVIITGSGSNEHYETAPDTVLDATDGTLESVYALAYKARSRFLSDERLHQLFPQTEQIADSQMGALFAPFFAGIHVASGDDYNCGINYTFGPEKIMNLHHLIGDGAGISVQMPFIDYVLWNFRAQIPVALRGGDKSYPPKFLLVEPFRELLPEAVITRKKIGYPSYYWYRGELDKLHEKLFSDAVRRHLPPINVDVARKIFQEELGSRRKSAGKATWGITVFLLWHLHFVEGWDLQAFV